MVVRWAIPLVCGLLAFVSGCSGDSASSDDTALPDAGADADVPSPCGEDGLQPEGTGLVELGPARSPYQTTVAHGRVYFATGAAGRGAATISRVGVRGGEVEQLATVPESTFVAGIAVAHCAVYWAEQDTPEAGRVYRRSLEGGVPELVHDGPVASLAFDDNEVFVLPFRGPDVQVIGAGGSRRVVAIGGAAQIIRGVRAGALLLVTEGGLDEASDYGVWTVPALGGASAHVAGFAEKALAIDANETTAAVTGSALTVPDVFAVALDGSGATVVGDLSVGGGGAGIALVGTSIVYSDFDRLRVGSVGAATTSDAYVGAFVRELDQDGVWVYTADTGTAADGSDGMLLAYRP
jgi:hypothetical protein